LDFEHDNSATTSSTAKEEEEEKKGKEYQSGGGLECMVESRLVELFESARKSGKDQMQVRLESKPDGAHAHMVNLFVFPFLSRNLLREDSGLKRKYQQLLDYMAVSPTDALPIYHELEADYRKRGYTEHTVICQVLVPCDEIFGVKDLATGSTIQGHEDGLIRKVWHLVRMEMVITTHPDKNRFILPVRHTQGNWQITDIDDLLDGNPLL
jgi:hypothetical protein